MDTATKDALATRFNELVSAGRNHTMPFPTLVLRWIHFCTELVSMYGMKTTSLQMSKHSEHGFYTANNCDDIAPSLGNSFKAECTGSYDSNTLFASLMDLQYFFDFFNKFKEEGPELWRMTYCPMGDFFSYASYTTMPVPEFLLNIRDDQFATLKGLTMNAKHFDYFDQTKLEGIFKEYVLKTYRTPDELVTFISGYQKAVPAKETMYGWMLGKHSIPTDKLVEYSDKTRSSVLAQALFDRPSNELPFSIFMNKEQKKKEAVLA